MATPRAAPAALDRDDGRNWRFAIAVAACFGVVLAIRLGRHGLWRDELQGWTIVRSSATPWALLHNLRYEGHPPLWYLVLWLPAHITASTFARCKACSG